MAEYVIGTFSFEKSTQNTYRYMRDNAGRKEVQYVPKSAVEGERPETIEVLIRY